MHETWPTVSATGHRPQHLTPDARTWTRAKLVRAAEWLRDERGTTTGISGMALFTDLVWADAVVKAGLTLGAYIPCPQQPDRWTPGDRREWQRLLDIADPAYSRTFATEYSPEAMRDRNEGMLADSDAVVCVWIPGKYNGGTWHAVRQAHQLHRPGVHLNPEAQTVRLGLPSIGRAAG